MYKKINILVEQTVGVRGGEIPPRNHKSFIRDVESFIKKHRLLSSKDLLELKNLRASDYDPEGLYETYGEFKFPNKKVPPYGAKKGPTKRKVYGDLADLYIDWTTQAVDASIDPPESDKDDDDKEIEKFDVNIVPELMDREAQDLIKELDRLGIKTTITGENQLGGSTQLTTEICENPLISSAAGFVAGYTPDLLLRKVGTGAMQKNLMSRIQRAYGSSHKIAAAADDAEPSFFRAAQQFVNKYRNASIIGGAITVGTAVSAAGYFLAPGLVPSLELGLKKMVKEPKTTFELFDLLLKWNKTNDNFLKETDDGLSVLDPCFATAFFATFGTVALYRGAHGAKMEGFIKYLKAPAQNVTAKGIDKIPGGKKYRAIMESEYRYLLGDLENMSTFKSTGPLVDDKVREHLQGLLANNAAELKRILFDDDAIGKVNFKGITSPEAKLLEKIMGVRLARRKAIEEVLRNSQRLVSETLASNIEFFKIFDMAAGDILDYKQVSYISDIVVNSTKNHREILKKSLKDFKSLKKQTRSSLRMNLEDAKKLSKFENLVDEKAFVSASEPISKTDLFDLIKKHFKGDKEMLSKFIGPSQTGDAMQELTEFGTTFHQLHTARAKILLEVDRHRLEQLSYLDLLDDSKVSDQVVIDLRTRISKIANDEDQALFKTNLSMNEDQVINTLKRQELPLVPFFNAALKQRKLAIGANLALSGASAFVFQSTASRLVDSYLLGIKDISPTQAEIIHKVLNNPNSSRSKVVEKAIAYAYSKMAEDMGHMPGMQKPEIDGLQTVLGRELPFNNLKNLSGDSKFKGISISFLDQDIKSAFNPNEKDKKSTEIILNILVLEYFKNPHEKDKVATKKSDEEVTVTDIIETVNFFAAEGESVLGPAHYNALFEKSYGEVRAKIRGFSKQAERIIKAQEKEQEQSSDVETTKEEIYPIINGKNFVIPVPGLRADDIGIAGFHQNRGGGKHGAIDLFSKPNAAGQRSNGDPILAIADGKVVSVVTVENYSKKVGRYADFVNDRINQGKLFGDIIKALEYTSGSYAAAAEKPGISEKQKKYRKGKAKYAQTKIDEIEKKKKSGFKIPSAPGDSWESFRQWSNDKLGKKMGANMLRHHRKYERSGITDSRAKLGIGGVGITIETDPDQNGKTFEVYYGHLSATNVKTGDTVKAGQKIGELGQTAIFDNNGQHLHLRIGPLGGQIDPETLIPGLKSNRKQHVPYYKKEEANTMNKKDLRQIVSEMLNENSGMGYGGYPYQSNEYDEEEPDQDYQVEWTSFIDEVCGPRKKAIDGDPKTFEDIAIEVAKLFVKDSDLFRDVLELAGANKSLGTEILRQTKEAREKQE